jgi:phenylacetic acid degradation operon negative regulatory protein
MRILLRDDADDDEIVSPGDVSLPTSARLRPQHLLLTLLGDYWYGQREHLPSAALVGLLGEFGVTAASARAALSRLQRRGLLESTRAGRRAYYGLTDRAAAVLVDGRERILRFAVEEQAWDGHWTLVCFSVPERERQVRHLLRTRLAWLGFASLYDGVWVSTHRPMDELRRELANLGIDRANIFVGRTMDPDGGLVEAWDLGWLRQEYVSFIEEFRDLQERMRAGSVGAAEALAVRTRVMDAWRRFPTLDPELPQGLLPAEWPRGEARCLFAELYDSLGPLAVLRVQQVLAPHGSELAATTRFHTTAAETGTATSAAPRD